MRLRIDGLETDCAHVTKIDSLSLGQKVAEDYIGESRDAQKEAGSLEYSDLVIRLPEMYATGFSIEESQKVTVESDPMVTRAVESLPQARALLDKSKKLVVQRMNRDDRQ